ncbi:hypothetical protein BKA61DRAFT_722015 [Leptodontidium sp. MPI-SDFR-AT-0119]|nr:hypothetical protein BKA61DRAFT_722015 [Leptodontidium sp. MPI-SDFR-AT-0119]
MAATAFKGEKLVGKSNYIEWINPARGRSVLAPYSQELAVKYYEKLDYFKTQSQKALGALKSIISLENQERFKDKNTAKKLWNAIQATFGQSILELSIDEYTSVIQSSAIYLKQLDCEIPKPVIASLILKGLPSSFDAFSSRKYEKMSGDLKNIDIDGLINDLISEEARIGANADLNANKASKGGKSNNRKYCNKCRVTGHITSTCWVLHPELKPNNSENPNNKPNKAKKAKELIRRQIST